jgi:hypothetical protein
MEESKVSETTNTSVRIDPNDKNLIIQQYCNSYYVWKAETSQQSLPEHRKEAINSLANSFVIKFFSINRGDTNSLKNLTQEFLETIKKSIRNLKVDDADFISKFEENFNEFHYEISNLQIEKTNDALSTVKRSFLFKLVEHRIFLPDLLLENEESLFREKMFKLKAFTVDLFSEEFIKTFKEFIIGYNPATEKALRQYFEKIMMDFDHKFEITLSKIKKKILEIVNQLIQSIIPMKVTISMRQINEGDEEKSHSWEVVYEEFLDTEPVELKQVVCLANDFALITLSLKDFKHLLIVYYQVFRSFTIDKLVYDENTVIASGSCIDSIILLHNTLRKAYVSCFTDENLIIRKEIEVYHESVNYVTSGCYLKFNSELILLYNQGQYLRIMLEKKNPTNLDQVVPINYKTISISNDQRFIIMTSDTETYLFSNKMYLIYMDHSVSMFSCVRNNTLNLVNTDENGVFRMYTVGIEAERMVSVPEVIVDTDRINSEAKRTFQLAATLFSGFFKSNNFSSGVPKSIHK